MTRLMGKGNKEKCWLSHFQHQHEFVIVGEGALFFYHKLTDPLFLIFGKLYFSDTVKEFRLLKEYNRIFAIKLCIHITNYHILHHHRYP